MPSNKQPSHLGAAADVTAQIFYVLPGVVIKSGRPYP